MSLDLPAALITAATAFIYLCYMDLSQLAVSSHPVLWMIDHTPFPTFSDSTLLTHSLLRVTGCGS